MVGLICQSHKYILLYALAHTRISLSPLVPYSFSQLPSYACQVLGKLLLAAPLYQRPPNGGSRFEGNLDGRILMSNTSLYSC